jgi:hypothetical protein
MISKVCDASQTVRFDGCDERRTLPALGTVRFNGCDERRTPAAEHGRN